jgi:ABC-type cobalamin/Fe3+-siderophores transport system ATPase subunit
MRIILKGDIGYNKNNPVIKQANLNFTPGKLYCILGPNGCGKTTLLLTLSGILPPISGTLDRIDADNRLYIPPDPPYLPTLRIGDVILHIIYGERGIVIYKKTTDDRLKKATETLRLLELNKRLEEHYENLSTGEKMKVILTGALSADANALFLDEPNNHLDIKSRLILYNQLKQVAKEKIVVISLHDINEAAQNCDEVILITREKRAYGPEKPLILLTKENLERSYGVKIMVGKIGNQSFFVPALST